MFCFLLVVYLHYPKYFPTYQTQRNPQNNGAACLSTGSFVFTSIIQSSVYFPQTADQQSDNCSIIRKPR